MVSCSTPQFLRRSFADKHPYVGAIYEASITQARMLVSPAATYPTMKKARKDLERQLGDNFEYPRMPGTQAKTVKDFTFNLFRRMSRDGLTKIDRCRTAPGHQAGTTTATTPTNPTATATTATRATISVNGLARITMSNKTIQSSVAPQGYTRECAILGARLVEMALRRKGLVTTPTVADNQHDDGQLASMTKSPRRKGSPSTSGSHESFNASDHSDEELVFKKAKVADSGHETDDEPDHPFLSHPWRQAVNGAFVLDSEHDETEDRDYADQIDYTDTCFCGRPLATVRDFKIHLAKYKCQTE